MVTAAFGILSTISNIGLRTKVRIFVDSNVILALYCNIAYNKQAWRKQQKFPNTKGHVLLHEDDNISIYAANLFKSKEKLTAAAFHR